MIAKCGGIVVWHWAHENSAECDPWAEPDSEWHRGWQEFALPGMREVVMGPHRADIFTPSGRVVELQHSNLSVDEIGEREQFYGPKMIWLWDCREARAKGRLDIRYEQGVDDFGLPWASFRWKHPRKTLAACRRSRFLDIGGEILILRSMETDKRRQTTGWGSLRPARDFCALLGYEPWPDEPD
jgi:competence protein CoiA